MLFNHTGLANRSLEDAIRFYRDFLKLGIVKHTSVPAELSSQLFSVPADIEMIVFEKGNIKIEVFIMPEFNQNTPELRHFGLYVDNIEDIMSLARQAGVEIISGKTKDKTVHFLKDFSGNLIEIKQK